MDTGGVQTVEQEGRIFPVCRARRYCPCPGAIGAIALHRFPSGKVGSREDYRGIG